MSAVPRPRLVEPSGFYYPRAEVKLLANIPQELTKHKSWVVWEEKPNGPSKKYRKMPLNPLTLSGIEWNLPENWSHRAVATQVFEENPNLRGIGFVFSVADKELGTTGEPYAFFDLDGVIAKDKLAPWATEFVAMANSYTEVSPSGTGVKIIVRAKVGARGKTFEFKDGNGDAHELEVYDCNRFFAATGDRLESAPREIADCQELLDTLHPPGEGEELLGPLPDREKDQYASDVDKISDESLIHKIAASSTGKKFLRLMNGKKTGYAGNFAASGALCSILAFWTRANPERIDRIFRQSNLFVDWWWEEKKYSGARSRAQYVIEKACKRAASKEMYTPLSTGLLTNEDGSQKPILANAITLIKTTPELKDALAFNEFNLRVVTKNATPWQPKTHDWSDYDSAKLAELLQHKHCFVNSRVAGEAAVTVAKENLFHPIRDYLEGLVWDGIERIPTWLTTYLGVIETPFSKAAGACWLVSAVARIFQPGCQVDHVLMLEGPQGIKKSTALRTLAGEEFFSETISDLGSKDSRVELAGVWIQELSELASLRASEVERAKAFLTTRVDHYRAPYDRYAAEHLRQTVFAATTNQDSPFEDETGNRRFWPFKCGAIRLDELARDRNQIWAEAYKMYLKRKEWWLTKDELTEAAKSEQDQRLRSGVWDDLILPWLENPSPAMKQEWHYDEGTKKNVPTNTPIEPFSSNKQRVRVIDVLIHAIGKPPDRLTQQDQNAVARFLKRLGYRKMHAGTTNRTYFYERPASILLSGRKDGGE
jgi:predicted P-loop ATPase